MTSLELLVISFGRRGTCGISLLTNHIKSMGAAMPQGTTIEVMKKKTFCNETIFRPKIKTLLFDQWAPNLHLSK